MSGGSSGHPVDRLIRRTILTQNRPSRAEIDDIIRHVAYAPFSRDMVRMDRRYVLDASQNGFHVPERVDARTAHIAKHIWAQEQWLVTTTESEYLQDIRTIVTEPTSRVALYLRSRRPMLAVLGRTERVVPIERTGPNVGSYLLVVYSPDNAMIVSAYMILRERDANIPADAIWLT